MSETEQPPKPAGSTRTTDVRIGGSDTRMGWPGAIALIFVVIAIATAVTLPEVSNSFEPCGGDTPVSFTRFPDGHEVTICR